MAGFAALSIRFEAGAYDIGERCTPPLEIPPPPPLATALLPSREGVDEPLVRSLFSISSRTSLSLHVRLRRPLACLPCQPRPSHAPSLRSIYNGKLRGAAALQHLPQEAQFQRRFSSSYPYCKQGTSFSLLQNQSSLLQRSSIQDPDRDLRCMVLTLERGRAHVGADASQRQKADQVDCPR